MKKTAAVILIFVLFIALLNVNVTTRQGVNFRVSEIRLPLYLKALDYLDRHYNYVRVVSAITDGARDKDEKVLKIFDWVHSSIKRTPPGFPIMDDHPLNIIIRGYGVEDQFEDIFTILCYYAGLKAFYANIQNSKGEYFQISFVRLKNGWVPMSAYYGIYSKTGGRPAVVKEILRDNALIAPFMAGVKGFDKEAFFNFINTARSRTYMIRAAAQSPVGRIACRIRRFFPWTNKPDIK
jgi:hypothetical protein